MKRLTVFFLLALLCISLGAPAFAQTEAPATLPNVIDAADIISESENETLNTLARQVTDKYSCGVYIVTIDDYRKYTDGGIDDCAEAIYKEFQLGVGEEKTVIMLILSMYDRDYDLCAFGSLAHRAFTDYGKRELTDVFLDNFRSDDWYGGFVDYIRGCEELLGMEAAGQSLDVPGYDSEPRELPQGAKMAIVITAPCVVALIVCLIFVFQMRSAKLKTEAGDYVVPDSLRLTSREDVFTHRTETRELIQQNRSGSGGGTSINAGGFSHSSGKF